MFMTTIFIIIFNLVLFPFLFPFLVSVGRETSRSRFDHIAPFFTQNSKTFTNIHTKICISVSGINENEKWLKKNLEYKQREPAKLTRIRNKKSNNEADSNNQIHVTHIWIRFSGKVFLLLYFFFHSSSVDAVVVVFFSRGLFIGQIPYILCHMCMHDGVSVSR